MTLRSIDIVLRQLRRLAGPPGAELTDRQLLRLFAAERNEAAFSELVRRHGPMVWGVSRDLLGNTPDAEDCFQATFLVLVRKAAATRWDNSVAHWLYEVARRIAWRMRTQANRSALSGAGGGRPADTELVEAWDRLAGLDAGRGYAGMAALAAAPAEAVLLLRAKLRPAPVPTDADLDRLVGQLDAAAFADRQRALAELERFGPNAVAGVKARLARTPTLEVRKRLLLFLDQYDGPNRYHLRCVRGVATLEAIGTADARALLAQLAKGPADDLLTREARAATRRGAKSQKGRSSLFRPRTGVVEGEQRGRHRRVVPGRPDLPGHAGGGRTGRNPDGHPRPHHRDLPTGVGLIRRPAGSA